MSDERIVEDAFRRWYAAQAAAQGLDPNPDAPEHFYDYRAAFKAGAGPDKTGHWPSKFKLEGHPRMILDGVNTKTGAPSQSSFFDSVLSARKPGRSAILDDLDQQVLEWYRAQRTPPESRYRGAGAVGRAVSGAQGQVTDLIERFAMPPTQEQAARAFAPIDPDDEALQTAMGFGPFGVGNVAKAVAQKLVPELPQMLREVIVDGRRTLPEMAQRYPETAFPVPAIDKTSGKPYAAKNLSDEEVRVQALRNEAQSEIDKGNYKPLFDIAQREHVNPADYPQAQRTINEAIPKMFQTFDNWAQKFDTPEVRQRLLDAYDAAAKDPKAHNWYAMRQLQRAFMDELGPEAGRKAFRESFALPMAATTGGADPTANLLTAAYGNFMRKTGKDLPANAFELPHPVGGRYVSGNIEMYDKVFNQGKALTAGEQPKRFNFGGNFMGHEAPTIDEQIMKIFDPSGKLKAPPGDSYGVLEEIINQVARERGVSPRDFQDVAWAGAKAVGGMPMMQHVNEMIERTARVTGKSPEEVLRGFIRSEMPMYSGFGVQVAPSE